MSAPTAPVRAPGRLLPALLLVLTVFGPISMDLYLPALPALTAEMRAVTSVAQLTVTACLLGLAAGQLIAGPLSDRYGRRGILLTGIVAYIVTSALCAIAPSIEVLLLARVVQGLAGGVGIVIATAAGRDIFTGSTLIRFYGSLTVVGGLAAIVSATTATCSAIGSSSARFSARGSSMPRCSRTSRGRPSCCRTSTGCRRNGMPQRSG
ncbi:MAG: Bcr/CflA family drug resistance efflux transporter [Microbacterium sp.]|nr:Bcr/CflA family drug resistance efflux transporter [Microbacterium sp.]